MEPALLIFSCGDIKSDDYKNWIKYPYCTFIVIKYGRN